MSWYRLYRPQTVAALHIAPVREAFSAILESGEYSHAYLLVGPKGTGKTSGARILAKVLNCDENRSYIQETLGTKKSTHKKTRLHEPCNVCQTCVAITNGSSLCVTEMDAASNRGIDDIRALTERIGLSAGDGPINVIIIDEVHMLTTEAFNALLKVLEEPPAHVVFILATTDPQKMPQTVISRCQVVQYRKATQDEIISALSTIAQSEQISVPMEVFTRLVSYADGSFRDGVKAFEQVAKHKKQITIDDINSILGISVSEIAESLVQALAKKDYTQAADIFMKIENDGIDALTVQKEVLKSLHVRLLAAPKTKSPHFPVYVALMKTLNVSSSPALPFPGLPFEIACLEWCLQGAGTARASQGPPLPPVVRNSATSPAGTASQTDTSTEVLRKKKDLNPPEDTELDTEEEHVVERAEEPLVMVRTQEVPSILVEFATVLEQWHVVLRGVREKNSSLEVFLKTTRPVSIEHNVLRIEAFYQFHKDQLSLDRNLIVLEEVLSRTFTAHMRVEIVLGKKALDAAKKPDSNLSGIVDVSFVKAAEDAFL